MVKKYWLILFFILCLFPLKTLAISSGFVPATGIWFSATQIKTGLPVTIYSVIVNNDYPWFSGQVGFYDNNKLFNTVEVKNIAKETTALIKASWTPTVGEHALSAQFIKAAIIDSSGVSKTLDVSAINNVSGLPLVVSGGAVVSALPAADASVNSGGTAEPNSATGAGGAVTVQVNKQGDNLVIAAPVNSVSANTIAGAVGGVSNYVEQNRGVLNKAQQLAGTVTSTAGKIEAAYEGTKNVINKTQEIYNQGQQTMQKARPYLDAIKNFLDKLSPWWNLISNNNDPKRIAIIIIAVIVVWVIYRLTRGRVGQYYDR